jgi:hypothetical protein
MNHGQSQAGEQADTRRENEDQKEDEMSLAGPLNVHGGVSGNTGWDSAAARLSRDPA